MTAGSPISSVAQSTSSQAGEPRAPAGAVPTQDDASAAVAVVQEVKASGTAATAPQRKKRTGEVALLEMLSGQMKRARTEPSAGGDAVHSNGTSVVMRLSHSQHTKALWRSRPFATVHLPLDDLWFP